MPNIVERLETRIRRHITEAMPAKPGYLEEQTLSSLLIDYRAWRGRFVEPRPRKLHLSPEHKRRPRSKGNVDALTAIESKIVGGEDLNPHLSTRTARPVGGSPTDPLPNRSDRDLLLAAWGVHHLHLSTEPWRNGFNKRTGDVLFVVFRDSDAYVLGVFKHPQHENWAAEEIFAVMARNWPKAGLVLASEYATGLSQEYSDSARLELREAGMNSSLLVDGKVYSPGGIGMTLDGSPLQAVQESNALAWELKRWREDPDRRLSEMEDVPSSAYWLPAISAPVPGFQEYCGFATGATFRRIGRLC